MTTVKYSVPNNIKGRQNKCDSNLGIKGLHVLSMFI